MDGAHSSISERVYQARRVPPPAFVGSIKHWNQPIQEIAEKSDVQDQGV